MLEEEARAWVEEREPDYAPFPPGLADPRRGEQLGEETSHVRFWRTDADGRWSLVEGGLAYFRERPFVGDILASEPEEYAFEVKSIVHDEGGDLDVYLAPAPWHWA